ncbi:MAG: ribosomal L7Ae/L30e/S12e/Gadd45 family protein [archaeon]
MTEKLFEALKEKKLIIGLESVQKSLRAGEIKEIFLSANCPELMRSKIKLHAEMAKVPVLELGQTSEEVGALCKKPFAITVAAIKKVKE